MAIFTNLYLTPIPDSTHEKILYISTVPDNVESCKNIFIEQFLCGRHFAKCFLRTVIPYRAPWERARCYTSHLTHTETWVTRPNCSAIHCRAKVMGEHIHWVCFDSSDHAPAEAYQRGSQSEPGEGQWATGESLSTVQPEDRQLLRRRSPCLRPGQPWSTPCSQPYWWAWERRRERAPWWARAERSFPSTRETPEVLGRSVGFMEGELSTGAPEAL